MKREGTCGTGGAVYDRIGVGYAELRRPDPHFRRAIEDAVGSGTVVNVGAGTGSYEPASTVVAVEPSPVMLAQRPRGSAPAVQAVAEALPFADNAFDVALALFTTHHWTDARTGLRELTRVSRRQVVLTWDQAYNAEHFWFVRDYLPEAAAREAGLAALATTLEAWPGAQVRVVEVPHDCTDGFFAAYWRRPEAFLVPAVRSAISALALLDPEVVDRAVSRLAADLDTGAWARRYAGLLARETLDCGYGLVLR
ncbi:MAG: class I SAM-dependent methyltransferase [Mycobacteriales bacterium]